MKRLTKHFNKYGRVYCFNCKENISYSIGGDFIAEKALNKLGQLEDIMEKYDINSPEELEHIILNDATGEQAFKDYRDSITKDLEVLEIIKKKRVNVGYLVNFKDYSKYKESLDSKWTIIKQISSEPLTETEFNLIKEWLER